MVGFVKFTTFKLDILEIRNIHYFSIFYGLFLALLSFDNFCRFPRVIHKLFMSLAKESLTYMRNIFIIFRISAKKSTFLK